MWRTSLLASRRSFGTRIKERLCKSLVSDEKLLNSKDDNNSERDNFGESFDDNCDKYLETLSVWICIKI